MRKIIFFNQNLDLKMHYSWINAEIVAWYENVNDKSRNWTEADQNQAVEYDL